MKTTLTAATMSRIRIACLALAFAGASVSGWSAEQSVSMRAIELLKKLDESKDFPSLTPRELSARERIREEVGRWKDDASTEQGIFLGEGYGCGVKPDSSALQTALGKPDRETTEELKPLKQAAQPRPAQKDANGGIQLVNLQPFARATTDDGREFTVLADKDEAGKMTMTPLVDSTNGKALSGKVLWYGAVGFGFVRTAYGGERLAVVMVQGRAAATGDVDSNPSQPKSTTEEKKTPADRMADALLESGFRWVPFENSVNQGLNQQVVLWTNSLGAGVSFERSFLVSGMAIHHKNGFSLEAQNNETNLNGFLLVLSHFSPALHKKAKEITDSHISAPKRTEVEIEGCTLSLTAEKVGVRANRSEEWKKWRTNPKAFAEAYELGEKIEPATESAPIRWQGIYNGIRVVEDGGGVVKFDLPFIKGNIRGDDILMVKDEFGRQGLLTFNSTKDNVVKWQAVKPGSLVEFTGQYSGRNMGGGSFNVTINNLVMADGTTIRTPVSFFDDINNVKLGKVISDGKAAEK